MKLLSLTINDTKVLPPSGIPSGTPLGTLLELFINIFMIVGVIIAIFYIFYGGWLWIVSGGDKTKIEKARMTIIYTFIGLALMAVSLLIVSIVGNVLGMNLITIIK